MKKFLLDIVCDAEGYPSCTTILAVLGFIFWVSITLILFLQNKAWAHYDVFTGVLVPACFGAQVTGKFINSRGSARIPNGKA